MNEVLKYKIALVAFMMDYLSKESIIRWTEIKIKELENPDIILYDLVLCNNTNDLISLLNQASNDTVWDSSLTFDLEAIFMGHFNFLIKSKIDPIEIGKGILSFYDCSNLPIDDDKKLFLSILGVDLSLRNDGYKGTMDIPEELQNYTKEFESRFLVLCDSITKLDMELFSWLKFLNPKHQF